MGNKDYLKILIDIKNLCLRIKKNEMYISSLDDEKRAKMLPKYEQLFSELEILRKEIDVEDVEYVASSLVYMILGGR